MGVIWSALLDLSHAIVEALHALENARPPTKWLAALQRLGGFYNIVPRRYAYPLGNALRFNTTVNSLSLDVYKLTQPDRGKPITNGQLGILAQLCGYQFGIADSMLGIDYYIRFELT
jgi:hypothetical protein